MNSISLFVNFNEPHLSKFDADVRMSGIKAIRSRVMFVKAGAKESYEVAYSMRLSNM